MHKRIVSLLLVVLMCLSAFPLSASEASAVISASYDSGVMTYTGKGFSQNTNYEIKLVDTVNTLAKSVKQTKSDAYGNINATDIVGSLGSLSDYQVYINNWGGSSYASTSNLLSSKVYYYITVLPGTYGTGSSSTNMAEQGSIVTLTAQPDAGYQLSHWETIQGGTVNGNTLTVGSNNVVVRPIFETAVPSISATYVNGIVTYTGANFSASTNYTLRIVGQGKAISTKNIVSGTNGSINATDTVGNLDAGTYTVYVDNWYGSSEVTTTFTVSSKSPTVDSVTVTPVTATVSKSGTQQFTASVNGTNNPAQTVTWMVTGNASANTKILDDGLLTVGSDETASVLTVTATSMVDTSKSGEATVTVTGSDTGVYTLTVSASLGGSAKISGAGTTGSYAEGAEVSITATPNSYYSFSSWSSSNGGTFANKASTATTFTMPAGNVTLIANFAYIGGSSGGGGSTGSGGSSGSGGSTETSNSTTIVTINGKNTKVTKNADGSISLTAADIAAYSDGLFTLGLPVNPETGKDHGAYVAVVRMNGKDIIIPLSLYEKEKVYALVSSAGTYSVLYNLKSFNDVSRHWAKDYITFVTARELFSGIGNGKFDPDSGMTRAMFATVLARLDGADVSHYEKSRFTDVAGGEWYTSYIEWAAGKNIVKGVGDNKFDPNAKITREQMTVMLMNYLQYKGYKLKDVVEDADFNDVNEISSWAVDSVAAVQRTGIISGKPSNQFDPLGTATRAEVATIFARFIQAILK